MSIIRYNPSEFAPVSFKNLINTFFNDARDTTSAVFVPNANTIERDDSFVIQVEAPGMKKDDFHVELDNNYLTISGERKLQSEEKQENYHSIETSYGAFRRSFVLPEQAVETDKIKAEYSNGILELTVPKDKKKAPKQIAIKVN